MWRVGSAGGPAQHTACGLGDVGLVLMSRSGERGRKRHRAGLRSPHGFPPAAPQHPTPSLCSESTGLGWAEQEQRAGCQGPVKGIEAHGSGDHGEDSVPSVPPSGAEPPPVRAPAGAAAEGALESVIILRQWDLHLGPLSVSYIPSPLPPSFTIF